MPRRSTARITLFAFSAALLTACSGGPSDADITAALDKSLAESVAPMKTLGLDLGIKVTRAKQIGCTRDKEGAAYICDVQMTISQKSLLTGKEESKDATDKVRLVKTDAGWVVSSNK